MIHVNFGNLLQKLRVSRLDHRRSLLWRTWNFATLSRYGSQSAEFAKYRGCWSGWKSPGEFSVFRCPNGCRYRKDPRTCGRRRQSRWYPKPRRLCCLLPNHTRMARFAQTQLRQLRDVRRDPPHSSLVSNFAADLRPGCDFWDYLSSFLFSASKID